MWITELRSDEEILSARSVMLQLRGGVQAGDYLATVRRMMEGGYRQSAVFEDGEPRAVAGFRIFEMLYAGGPLMYVDDLSTDERVRSRGHGRALLAWLKEEARLKGCVQFHLDSGVQRAQAHRFYFREGLTVNCFHFWTAL